MSGLSKTVRATGCVSGLLSLAEKQQVGEGRQVASFAQGVQPKGELGASVPL